MAAVPMGQTTRLVLRDTRRALARAYAGHLTDADRRLLVLAHSMDDEVREACERPGAVLVA